MPKVTVHEHVIPQFEARIASRAAMEQAQADRRARKLEREAEEVRQVGKLRSEEVKNRGRALVAQAKAEQKTAQEQAKMAGDQPVTLEVPYQPQQIQQVGSNQQSAGLGEIPVSAGREAPLTQVDLSGLEQKELTTESDTQVPVRTSRGVWMAPVRSTRRSRDPRLALEAAQEMRLRAQLEDQRKQRRFEGYMGLMESGVTRQELPRDPGNWNSFSPVVQDKVARRIVRERERRLRIEDATLDISRKQAEAVGDRAKAASIDARRAQLQAEMEADPESVQNKVKMMMALAQILYARAGLEKPARDGLLANTGAVNLSYWLNSGEPPPRTFSDFAKVTAALQAGAARIEKIDFDKVGPDQVMSDLQMPAAKINRVVVKAGKRGRMWYGLEGIVPAFDLAPWEDVMDTMRMAERTPWAGATDEQLEQVGKEAEDRLREWGLVARVDEANGNRLDPVTEGPLSRVSNDIISIYYQRKKLARDTGIPFSAGTAPLPPMRNDSRLIQAIDRVLPGLVERYLGNMNLQE